MSNVLQFRYKDERVSFRDAEDELQYYKRMRSSAWQHYLKHPTDFEMGQHKRFLKLEKRAQVKADQARERERALREALK